MYEGIVPCLAVLQKITDRIYPRRYGHTGSKTFNACTFAGVRLLEQHLLAPVDSLS